MKLLLLIALLFASYNMTACECKVITFKSETDHSDIIFRGKIIMKIDSLPISKFYYTFAISQVWKGEKQKTIVLTSWNNPAACGVNLDPGKEYIIYSKDGEITQCGRNELYSIGNTLPLLNYKYVKTDALRYGADNSDMLNSFESSYFNSVFGNKRYEPINNKTPINFTKGKVAYLINDTLVSKSKFFQYNMKFEPRLYFYKFKDKQVNKHGGYIGVISVGEKLKISRRSIYKTLEKPKH